MRSSVSPDPTRHDWSREEFEQELRGLELTLDCFRTRAQQERVLAILRFKLDKAGIVRTHSGNVRGFVKLPVGFISEAEASPRSPVMPGS